MLQNIHIITGMLIVINRVLQVCKSPLIIPPWVKTRKLGVGGDRGGRAERPIGRKL